MVSVVVTMPVHVRERLVRVGVAVSVAQHERHRARERGGGRQLGRLSGSPSQSAASATPKSGALAKATCARVAPSVCAAVT